MRPPLSSLTVAESFEDTKFYFRKAAGVMGLPERVQRMLENPDRVVKVEIGLAARELRGSREDHRRHEHVVRPPLPGLVDVAGFDG